MKIIWAKDMPQLKKKKGDKVGKEIKKYIRICRQDENCWCRPLFVTDLDQFYLGEDKRVGLADKLGNFALVPSDVIVAEVNEVPTHRKNFPYVAYIGADVTDEEKSDIVFARTHNEAKQEMAIALDSKYMNVRVRRVKGLDKFSDNPQNIKPKDYLDAGLSVYCYECESLIYDIEDAHFDNAGNVYCEYCAEKKGMVK